MSTGQMRKSEPLIRRFERICMQQLILCEELEQLADDLGRRPDRQRCIEMANRLGPVMDRAHEFERQAVFPALRAWIGSTPNSCDNLPARLLPHLESEHEDDFCLVGEVAEALLEFGGAQSGISPDAIGYLLRGLFVGLRRHIALERETLTAMAT